MRILILLALSTPFALAFGQVITPDQFQTFMKSSPAPGVYQLAPGTHQATDDRPMPVVDQSLDGLMIFIATFPDGRILFFPSKLAAAEAATAGGGVAGSLKVSVE